MAITLKQFIEKSSVPEPLVKAVIRQFGGWTVFRESARDIAKYGATGGYAGFSYYRDTTAFGKRNLKAILGHAGDIAESMGTNTYQLIADFNGIDINAGEVALAIHNHTSRNAADRTTVLNALAWFSLEEVAASLSDLV
jgi:hypothetical protein